MKGDFSRETFDPGKHYSGVLMQQGRVQLDADWNEQQDIHRHRTTTEARDVIGVSGAPLHAPGFKITTLPDLRSLIIGRGRYYVDGLLCENESDVPYASQPDLPNPPDIAAALTAAQATSAIIYLDVWQRHLTGLDDPLIRETALGGPDTTSRMKTVWQVKALVAKPDGGGGFSCGDSLKAWDDLTAPSKGMLSARAQPTQPADSPCLLPPGAGYRRLENQLYRVEVHTAGNLGQATFKWSRDNGAVVTSVEKINGQDITVHDLGRDDVLGFASGQWVEISDDAHELSGLPGQLLQIDHIDTANRIITVKPPAVTGIDITRQPKLRRWDGASATGIQVVVPATNDGFIPLEDGVEVKFASGSFSTGHYWLIPARTATGNVEWPFTNPQPPKGIVHHYARIAVATLVGGNAFNLQDCRKIFSPLAEQPPALHVMGINWVNDDFVTQDTIINGLRVTLDSSVNPSGSDSSNSIATLSLDMPMVFGASGALDVASTDGQVTGQITTILDGDVTFPQPNVLQWKPVKNGAEFKTLLTALVAQRVSRVRLRFTVKGHTVWQEGGLSLVYLDGQTLGEKSFRTDNTPRINLILPSGDGRRVSDFESWFYLQLTLPPSSLVDLSLSQDAVLAGTQVTGTVTLDFPAGTGGSNVTLTSSSPGVTFPSGNTVNVPATRLQAPFTINTNGITSTTGVLISATLGTTTKQKTLSVQVVSVTISPPALSMFSGQTQQFTATVSGASDPSVTWSLQEGANAGSINSSGLYVAPAVTAPSTFHVVATSVADRTKSATASVQVSVKPKEKEKDKDKDKEKEHKDKDKDHKDKDKDNKDKETHQHEVMSEPGRPILLLDEAMLTADGNAGAGRAFIRAAERPPTAPFNGSPTP